MDSTKAQVSSTKMAVEQTQKVSANVDAKKESSKTSSKVKSSRGSGQKESRSKKVSGSKKESSDKSRAERDLAKDAQRFDRFWTQVQANLAFEENVAELSRTLEAMNLQETEKAALYHFLTAPVEIEERIQKALAENLWLYMKLIVCLKMIKVDKLPVSKFAQKWEREYASLTSQFIHCCKDTEWVEKATVVERLGAGSFGEVEKVVDPDHPDSCLARKRNKRNDAKFLRGNPNGRYGLLVEKFLEYMIFPQRLVTDKFAWHFNEQDLVLDIYMRVFTPVMQSKVRFGKKECRVLGEELVSIHGKGLAHRDIKSANVFEGRLCDYGLSTWQSSTYFCGTPIFLAPELWQRKLTTDESVDLRNCDWWAFGVFMLEMFLRDNKEAWEKHVAPKYHRNKWWSTSLERYPAAEFSNDGGPALLYRREILPIALALIQEGIIPQKTAQDFPVELVRACLKKNPSERQEAVMVSLEKLIREQEQKFDPTEASFGACSTAVPSTFSGTTFGTVVGDTASTHESHQVC